MEFLRVYLLLGLIAHKAVWELMKIGSPPPQKKTGQSAKIRLIKAVKIGILVAIVAQTLAPEFLPVTGNPAALRILGAVLYTVGLATAICGRIQLGGNWLDIETAGVKREQATVSHGIYAYVRHPIYTGDLLLLLGLQLALNSWAFVGVIILAPVILRQAIAEEEMLKRTLPGYDVYCQRTRRFIPFVA
jgi:protein-S-isoprenylcysteine O-methyltransferase Ste14